MARRLLRMLFIIPLAILGMLLFVFIGGEIVLHLWNWLLPSLLGWRDITFWQGAGILALSPTLFGRLRSHPARPSRLPHRTGNPWPPSSPRERKSSRPL